MLVKNVYSRQYISINQNNSKLNEIKPKTSFNNLNNIPLKQTILSSNTQREFGTDITNQFHLTTYIMNKENINQKNKEKRNEKNSLYLLNNQENKENIPKTFEINFPKPRKLQSQEKITSQKEIYIDYEKKLNYSNELKNKNQSQKEESILENSSFNSSISNIIILNDKEDFKEIINEPKNPQEVDDYFNDIYTYFKEEEEKFLPKQNYMSYQTDINEKMREILFDWLIEVHKKFKLSYNTLYITGNLIDRFTEKNPELKRTKYQLLGVSSMFIAGKYNDIYPPQSKDYSYITDDAFTKKEVVEMEMEILKQLNYTITFPTQYNFLEIYKKLLNMDDETFHLSFYLIDICFINYKMIKYKPSFLAAAACLLSFRLLKIYDNWEEFENITGYNVNELYDCVIRMAELIEKQKNTKLKGVYKKFSSENFSEIAKMKLL
jgi:cyclin B